MTICFGEKAAGLAGLSARVLGWRPAEFWNATPADLRNALYSGTDTADMFTRGDLNHLLERENHG